MCVDLRGATQSTSQDLTIAFTPQLKPSAANQATRKNNYDTVFYNFMNIEFSSFIPHTI